MERRQHVDVNGEFSGWSDVTSGNLRDDCLL